MRINSLIKSTRGDTIVEVLLSLVVMGVVLAGSYSLANRALIVNQNASERTVAVNILRQQLELARALGGNTVCDGTSSPFFMTYDQTTKVISRQSSDTDSDIFEIELACSTSTTNGVWEVTARADWQAIGAANAAAGEQNSVMVLRIAG